MEKTPDYTKKAVNNYRNKFDIIQVRFPKGTKEKLQEVENINDYIVKCVLNALDCSQYSEKTMKTKEPEKIPKAPEELNKPANKSVDLAELQKLLDQKRADVIREKRINNGEFMTVAKEEDEYYSKC